MGSDASRCWWNVARGSSVQPQLTQHVLADIAGLCSAIAVWGSNVAFWDVAVRYFTLLRSWCPWADVANVLSYVAYDPNVTGLLAGQPTVLPDVPFVLSSFASVQPPVTIVQPDVAAVFTDEPFVQPGLPAV